ncbi:MULTISPECIES: fumarylacetoacetate hydrolase family protein [Variovorax]|uniref:Fumarylacetoacetate hydrolase family protein n=1 Tax=Variovorax ginsengisoli TaxID=363844 RepID=A0ABT8SAP0_9BURK|nr:MULTISPECIES: fumarylacetoacetate hydrolase family protein [Variovorax]MDM0054571.1 fumarylacetoacetate hydrolase family protein [Variovorax sp. J22G47]MDN8616184.1 fumarylacetoacetate hydrolase family protein [Variovorax ginsengisoli]MDO1535354.1 fumarylacetoacetate hydrolase family protein [Variovorax ginsengisoli]
MKIARFSEHGRDGLAVALDGMDFKGLFLDKLGIAGDLQTALEGGPNAIRKLTRTLSLGEDVDLAQVSLRPPLLSPEKIICIGLNYVDHSAESGFVPPAYPTVFSRFNSSLIGHGDPIERPQTSEQLDYEGEIAFVIGIGGRNISKSTALKHVFGYSLFNDASLRDYQTRTPQWTIGKNFDKTGAFGPYLVTADELPEGAKGLSLQTRLNGNLVQDGNTDDLIFDIPTLIAELSAVMTLRPGDVVVTGTPAGVGAARKPPLWMVPGDVCEISASGLGTLRNPIVAAG